MHSVAYPSTIQYTNCILLKKEEILFSACSNNTNHCALYHLFSFVIFRIHVIGIIQYLGFQTGFFHLVICIYNSSLSFSGLIAYLYLLLNNTLLHGCIISISDIGNCVPLSLLAFLVNQIRGLSINFFLQKEFLILSYSIIYVFNFIDTC